MPDTSTVVLQQNYVQAKAECARLSEALRTFDPATSDASEAKLKAQLVKSLLELKALRTRLGSNASTVIRKAAHRGRS